MEESITKINNVEIVENSQNCQTLYFDNYYFIKKIKENINMVKNKETDDVFLQKIIPENESDINIFRYFHKKSIPHIPNIVEIKRIDNECFAIIKEFIQGDSLIDYLKKGNLNTSLFYNLMYKICDIFNYFHQLPTPIIYRDVKPENIIISNDNLPYIIDLDSMIFYDPSKKQDTHRKGTEGYASPEQYGFAASSPATDIYTIGRLMKHILPFFKNSHLNRKIEPIIEKCCKMDTSDRYKSVKQLKHELFKREKNYRLLSIPGFRNDNILHMIIALLFYVILGYFCFFNSSYKSFSLSFFTFLYIISITFISLNYLGSYRLIPLTKNKNLFIKFIGIAILTIISSLILFKFYSFIYSRI